jgi:hypothetical protein
MGQSYTKARLEGGGEREVGVLAVKGVSDPSILWPVDVSKGPLVFLSHRGPETKEGIVRPTNWFLREKMDVRTFFDESSMVPGHEKMLSLTQAAHSCSHALVLLTPDFRTSEYCVMELNTFMMRRDRGTCKIIPALWNMGTIKGEGYAPGLNDINWLKQEPRDDFPTYLTERLWPFLLQELGKTVRNPLNLRECLIQYVKENRGNKAIPPSLERLVTDAETSERHNVSMRMADLYHRQDETELDTGNLSGEDNSYCGSIAVMFSRSSSSSSLTDDSISIRAFEKKSADDKSFIKDYRIKGSSTWRYNWTRNPDGIGRDDANAFYYNPYVSYFKVQRVLVVDADAQQVMLCTPMNYAAYFIQKDVPESSINSTYEQGMQGASGEEMDKAFLQMFHRRCKDTPGIVYSGESQKLVIRIFHKNALEREWNILDFPSTGGWGHFLFAILQPKIRWAAIVEGRTGIRNNSSREDNCWTLIFRDSEAELLMGETRTFGTSEAVQFRGGAFGVFQQAAGERDMLVVPPRGQTIFNSQFRVVGGTNAKIWKLDMHQVCESQEALTL